MKWSISYFFQILPFQDSQATQVCSETWLTNCAQNLSCGSVYCVCILWGDRLTLAAEMPGCCSVGLGIVTATASQPGLWHSFFTPLQNFCIFRIALLDWTEIHIRSLLTIQRLHFPLYYSLMTPGAMIKQVGTKVPAGRLLSQMQVSFQRHQSDSMNAHGAGPTRCLQESVCYRAVREMQPNQECVREEEEGSMFEARNLGMCGRGKTMSLLTSGH